MKPGNCGTPTLFLDFDGVLHPEPVWRPRGRPIELDSTHRAAGRELFDRAAALAAALAGVEVRVVLSTSWVRVLGYARASKRLPPALASRVVGATYHSRAADRWSWDHLTRWEQIRCYVGRHHLTHWLAIDDDDDGWPASERHRLVWTLPNRGAADDDIVELVRRLRGMR
jgi:hypothetical protein